MESVNDSPEYENGVTDVIIHNAPESKSPESSNGLIKNDHVMHIYTNQVMEIEDAANDSITVEMEPEEKLEEHLLVLDRCEFQDIINRPEDLSEYSRVIMAREDLFKTFEDNQEATNEVLKTKWAAFLETTLRSRSSTTRSLWIWRTIFIILVVILVLFLSFTRRPRSNNYHIYN